MIGRLNHIGIAVPDLEKAAALYRDVLGATVSAQQPSPAHGVTIVFVDLPNVKLELLQPLGDTSPMKGFLEKNPAGGMNHMCFEVDDLRQKRETLLAGGGEEKNRARHDEGRMTARERLAALFQDGTLQEIGLFIRGLHEIGEAQQRDYPADGMVVRTGYVDGRPVAACSQDFTVAAGTLGKRHAQKMVGAMRTAAKSGMPIIAFNDSGGARTMTIFDAIYDRVTRGTIGNWLAIIGLLSLMYWGWLIVAALQRRKAAKHSPTVAAAAQAVPTAGRMVPESDPNADDIVVIAAAVKAMLGAHRLVRLAPDSGDSHWAREGGWMQQIPTRPAKTRIAGAEI